MEVLLELLIFVVKIFVTLKNRKTFSFSLFIDSFFIFWLITDLDFQNKNFNDWKMYSG